MNGEVISILILIAIAFLAGLVAAACVKQRRSKLATVSLSAGLGTAGVLVLCFLWALINILVFGHSNDHHPLLVAFAATCLYGPGIAIVSAIPATLGGLAMLCWVNKPIP